MTTERTVLANEEQYPWEVDPADVDLAAPVRWKTFVSGDLTPSHGLSMGIFEVAPGGELAPHHHAPQEIYYVTEGEAEVYLDGQWQPLRAGDVVYHPADSVHGARNRGATTCTIVWIFPTDTYSEIEYIDV